MKNNLQTGEMEFSFSDDEFNSLRKIVTGHTGIELPDNKKTLMYTRLARRLRDQSLTGFSDYIKLIDKQISDGKDDEMMIMVNAMTTNVTGFFREEHHFDDLAKKLPELYKKFGKIRVWSCAASTGQEPWTLAMVLQDFMERNPNCKDVKIIGTDIDKNVIKTATDGIYELPISEVEDNPYMKKYLLPHEDDSKNLVSGNAFYRISDKLRGFIEFHTMNLLNRWVPLGKGYNIIFCRNVVIYFSKETQRALFKNISAKMPKGSLLYIGHSESLLNVSEDFESTGRTSYIKK